MDEWFFKKQDQPVRLQRANATDNIFEKDIVIRISVFTAIILAMLLFVALCFILQPTTYGFLWW